MFCGLTVQFSSPPYFPPPLFASVPINWPLDVTKTCIVAFVRVLVASTRKTRFETVYSARSILTVSPAGVTVSVASRDVPFKEARMVAAICEETEAVVTVNVAAVLPQVLPRRDGDRRRVETRQGDRGRRLRSSAQRDPALR